MDPAKMLLGAGAGVAVALVFEKMFENAGLGAIGLIIPMVATVGFAGYIVGGGNGLIGAGLGVGGVYLWNVHRDNTQIQIQQAATNAYIDAGNKCTAFVGQVASAPGQLTPFQNCMRQNGVNF